jgi:hypothetical protein
MPAAAGADLLAAHQAGLSVIVKEAMANGRLTGRNADPGFASRLAVLQDTAQQVGSSSSSISVLLIWHAASLSSRDVLSDAREVGVPRELSAPRSCKQKNTPWRLHVSLQYYQE